MEWNGTNIFLLIFTIGVLLFTIYDGLVLSFWKGATKLKVPVRTRGRFDGYIFVGMLALLLFLNISRNGPVLTTILLGILVLFFVYIAFFRRPSAVFKETGLFYNLVFVPYSRIERINLSEDGILVIETGRQRLMIFPKDKVDLDKMLQVLAKYK
ncbi:hypothetical protein MFLO_10918 [Listeria floridensis FSL S10-1187]|uniref:UPF0266 membrane protein MFLO_10918 n=1 Tax=Listeria floridensis FSL S10-1187 TaxID=1265817 RepID=A0ABN0RDZ9_9LIST|nr:DUF986 family protein [Listeria floridensis]EUJ30327.1 hypothetical protein MFLO_10918 [Listeria floridensis FSL S10-1187]